MRLIGLHTRLHGGKDTGYGFIAQECSDRGLLAVRRAFADPLKISGMRALGFSNQWPDNDMLVALANQIKETGKVVVTWDGVSETGELIPKAQVITGRQLWQFYGSEAHRVDDLGSSFSKSFWVDNLLPLGEKEGFGDTPTIAIARPKFYDNFKESWAGYADIGVVTDVRFPNEAERVLALGGEVWKIDADERLGPNTDGHASEVPLSDHLVSKVVDNNGTLDQYKTNVLAALDLPEEPDDVDPF